MFSLVLALSVVYLATNRLTAGFGFLALGVVPLSLLLVQRRCQRRVDPGGEPLGPFYGYALVCGLALLGIAVFVLAETGTLRDAQPEGVMGLLGAALCVYVLARNFLRREQ